MPSLSAVAGAPPSLYCAPQGRPHPRAADAVDVASLAGLDLYDWQAEVLAESMRLRPEVDRWAAREAAVIVARQNGKGAILEARQLAGLFVLGERLQVHSAHEFKTCYEHFRRVKDLVEGCDLLREQVEIIRTGAGDQAIELKNGCRLRFIARSRSSGRGFSADTVYLDEAFELSDETVAALLPAMSARPNPQIWYTSSAPHASSMVLHRVRRRGVEGDDPRLYLAEWGNDPDVDPLDRDGWARANPSMGLRISEDDVAAEQRAMPPALFARERLGVPDAALDETQGGPISPARWGELVDGESLPSDESLRLALDAPPDRMTATFAVAGVRSDGLGHVSVRYHVPPHEMRALVAIAADLCGQHSTSLVLPPGSPVRAWRGELEAAGVPLDELTPAEYAEACGLIVAKVADGGLRHRGQPELSSAVDGLAVRTVGDVDVWARRTSRVNIAPFVAATCALVRVPDVSGRPYAGEVFSVLDDDDDDGWE